MMTKYQDIYDSLKNTVKIKTEKKAYIYYKESGYKRIPLPDPSFNTLQQCLDAYNQAREHTKRQREQPDYQVSELIDLYKEEIYKTIKERSKIIYEYHINKIKDEFNGKMIADVTISSIRALLDKHKNSVAITLGGHVNRFLSWCAENEFLLHPPAKIKIKRAKLSIGYNRWTEEDIANFRARWPPGSWPRLCMEVLLATGARVADVLDFDDSNLIQGNQLKYTSGKTGVPVHIQLQKDVIALLGHVNYGWPFIYNSDQGDKITYNNFNRRFKSACKAAGVHKPAHGLRKTFATRLAEQGKSEYAIMAAGGWKTPMMVSLYVKEFERSQAGLQATFDIVSWQKSET